ncbi:MAG: MerR family transcriptional regulator [Bacteroidota bacterium]|jgi:DNA-binding transcriptional MerR regulator
MSKTFEMEKIYFSISEVAEMFDVNASLLRFWEKEFPQLQPRKNSKGNRIYTKKDIELFKRIHELVRVKGFTLEGAKNALRTKSNAEEEAPNLQAKLLQIRTELVSIASAL